MPDITMSIIADHEWFREQFARLDNLQARTSLRKALSTLFEVQWE
jgi:hypothetical protein